MGSTTRAGGLVILRIVEICRWEASDVGNRDDDGLSAVTLVGMNEFAVTAHVHGDGELWLAVEKAADRPGARTAAFVPPATAGDESSCETCRSPARRRCSCGPSALALPRRSVSTRLVGGDVAAHRATGVVDRAGPAGDLPTAER